MRYSLLIAAAALTTLAGCRPAQPELVPSGPGMSAAPVAQWKTTAAPRQLDFSADGRLLVTSDVSGAIVVHDTRTWRTLRTFHHPGGATSLAISPDSDRLFSGGYDGRVRVWDLRGGKPIAVLTGPAKPVWTIDRSPDGDRIAAGSEDGNIYIWTLSASGRPTVIKAHDLNIWEVRFSPDGQTLASGSFDKTAKIWDAKTGQLRTSLIGHGQAVVGLAFTPDGSHLATCGDDSTIRFWRVRDGAQVRIIHSGNHTYKLDFSRDGRWLASGGRAYSAFGTLWHQVTGGGGQAEPIHIWRTADGAAIASLPAADDSPNIAFSPDGRWLATSGEDDLVRVWRLHRRAG